MSATMGWPKLSVTLPDTWTALTPPLIEFHLPLFPIEWGMCERCGGLGELFETLEVWREHDDGDRPTPVAVVLCRRCAKKLVPPHPRLYSSERLHVPLPGVMELCRDCPLRVGYRCVHPDLTTNGGPGLQIVFPEPMTAHVQRSPRRTSGWMKIWKGPPVSCAGKGVPDGRL